MTHMSPGLEDCRGTGSRLLGVVGRCPREDKEAESRGQVEERRRAFGSEPEGQAPSGDGGSIRTEEGGGWASMRPVRGPLGGPGIS